MLEKDIENLIAQHPDDFFPGEGFQLIQQQYPIAGKRIDLLFQDKLNRKVIVEVKRGILSREASGQVAEYYGLLKSASEEGFYEMVLCANIIPNERRVFLEHIGIECKELGIASIAKIARKYDYSFLDDSSAFTPVTPHTLVAERPLVYETGTRNVSVWIFQANPRRYDVLNALSDPEIGNSMHWLVNQHKSEIRNGHLGLIWLSGAEAGIYALTRIECDPHILREYPAEHKYWADASEKREAPRVEMTVLKRFVNKPILRKDLLEVPGLNNLSILRQSQATNFPVTDSEWSILASFM